MKTTTALPKLAVERTAFDDDTAENTQIESLTKQTLAGFKWTYLSTIIQAALTFATFSTLAHLLGPREFGIVSMATIFTNFIERVGFFGVGQAVVQREELTKGHVRCGFALCLFFGMLFFVLFFFAAPLIADFFNEPLLTLPLRIVSFSFVLACVSEIPLSLLQRDLKFKELLYVTNVSFFIGYALVGITMALLGWSFWSLIAAIVVARAVRLVLSFYARPQKVWGHFSARHAKDLLGIGIGFSLGRLTNYAALVGDEFVIGRLLGAYALGLYNRAYQLMTAPAAYFGQVLEKVLFAALAQRQTEHKKVAKYFLYGIELCSLVSISGASVLCVAAPEIIIVLFGEQWLEAVPAVRILGLGVFFRTCYKNSDTVIRALGAVYRLALRQGVYAAIVIGGSVVGSHWGIEGVAWAVLLAVFFNYALLSFLAVNLLSVPLSTFARAHAPALWLLVWQVSALLIFFSAFRAMNVHAFISLPLGMFVLVGVSLIALWTAPRFARPEVFVWMARNINFSRFGLPGALAEKFLLRGTGKSVAPLHSDTYKPLDQHG